MVSSRSAMRKSSMNDFFAAEPEMFETVQELRAFLSLFGPYAGRYLIAAPSAWRSSVIKHFVSKDEFKGAAASLVLRRAMENKAYLTPPSLPWSSANTWLENALALIAARPPIIDKVIVGSSCGHTELLELSQLELAGTADESISTSPKEYFRVCRTIIQISHELFFIDPYINPCRSSYSDVLRELFQAANREKCRRVVCYGRTANVLGEKRHTWNDVNKALTNILRSINWKSEKRFDYYLVSDENSRIKMHNRYLLSTLGGVRFGQGFQKRSHSPEDVSPMGKGVLDKQISIFVENEHDMQVDFHYSL